MRRLSSLPIHFTCSHRKPIVHTYALTLQPLPHRLPLLGCLWLLWLCNQPIRVMLSLAPFLILLLMSSSRPLLGARAPFNSSSGLFSSSALSQISIDSGSHYLLWSLVTSVKNHSLVSLLNLLHENIFNVEKQTKWKNHTVHRCIENSKLFVCLNNRYSIMYSLCLGIYVFL